MESDLLVVIPESDAEANWEKHLESMLQSHALLGNVNVGTACER